MHPMSPPSGKTLKAAATASPMSTLSVGIRNSITTPILKRLTRAIRRLADGCASTRGSRKWHLAVPPRVVDAMDGAQKWAIACTREALEDYGYPKRPLDPDRTAVILGNAMAGEKHYLTALRIFFPEYARELEESARFSALPADVRRDITRELHDRMDKHLPEITEDSMPGELSNCIAGRIANIFNFHGPNFVCDAACASAMAAINSAIQGLVEHHF